MRDAFSCLSIASPLYLATKSPFFTASSKYSPRPASFILDFAILTRFGLVLGLGRHRGLGRLFLLPFASLLLSVCLFGLFLATASLRDFADILRVLRLVVLRTVNDGVSSSWLQGGFGACVSAESFWLGVDVVDGGGGSGVSSSQLLLLLSKTIAAASSHVGMRGLVVVGGGRFGIWVAGDIGAFVGVVVGGGGDSGVSASLLLLLLLSKTTAAASSHVGMRGIVVGRCGSWVTGGVGGTGAFAGGAGDGGGVGVSAAHIFSSASRVFLHTCFARWCDMKFVASAVVP